MIKFGIDNIGLYRELFAHKKLGLITTPSGLSASGEAAVDLLHRQFDLAALFSPEHGVRGNVAAGGIVKDYADEETGVPVYSLYRADASRHMTDEMLAKVDALVYDVQDVGTRYYTFIYSMLYAMEDCAKAGKPFLVLDRPDPLDGVTVEGNVMKKAYESFIGAYPLCMRYGLTAGEFAFMANHELGLGCDLHVIPCSGWKRRMQYPDYGGIWVPPSPNIPRFESALLYPGLCLIEGTNLSEGRGTTIPFEVVGAPFVKASVFAREMNRKQLPGVWFRPIYFEPTVSKYQGELCAGVQIHVTDRHAVRPVDVGVRLICELRHEYGEQVTFRAPAGASRLSSIEMLSGDCVLGGEPCEPDEILAAYHAESARFKEHVGQFLFYD